VQVMNAELVLGYFVQQSHFHECARECSALAFPLRRDLDVERISNERIARCVADAPEIFQVPEDVGFW